MAARGATGGFVVTSGRFTEDATAFAKGRNIRLVDGPQLHALIRQARGDASPASVAKAPVSSEPGQAASTAASAPSCPLCDQPMVERTAKRGANAGKAFWGCAGYPVCRGTRAIR